MYLRHILVPLKSLRKKCSDFGVSPGIVQFYVFMIFFIMSPGDEVWSNWRNWSSCQDQMMIRQRSCGLNRKSTLCHGHHDQKKRCKGDSPATSSMISTTNRTEVPLKETQTVFEISTLSTVSSMNDISSSKASPSTEASSIATTSSPRNYSLNNGQTQSVTKMTEAISSGISSMTISSTVADPVETATVSTTAGQVEANTTAFTLPPPETR